MGRRSDIGQLEAKAAKGDLAALEELSLALVSLGRKRLQARDDGISSLAEDLCQDARIEFVRGWKPERGRAEVFFLDVVLKRKMLQALREQYRRARVAKELAATTPCEVSEPMPPSLDDERGLLPEALVELLKAPTVFLNESDRSVLSALLTTPSRTARQIAAEIGVSEAALSIVLNQKVPFELLHWWGGCQSTRFDTLSDTLERRVMDWVRAGEVTLAAGAADLFIDALQKRAAQRGAKLADESGELYIRRVLAARTQVALAEQDLAAADRSLSLLGQETMGASPRWTQAIHLLRGRRRTAEFRYADAAKEYRSITVELPRILWGRDPLFCHSFAVSLRGVGEYGDARYWMRQALDLYQAAGRRGDFLHTQSRLARVLTEHGVAGTRSSFDGALDLLDGLREQTTELRSLTPLGYVQFLLHDLRLRLALGTRGDAIDESISEVAGLINRGSYAHEWLEVEELVKQNGLKGSVLPCFEPSRARFGQKVLARIRASLAAHTGQ